MTTTQTQADWNETDLQILNSDFYCPETREIILGMDLKPSEKIDEAQYAYDEREITLSDFYYIQNQLSAALQFEKELNSISN